MSQPERRFVATEAGWYQFNVYYVGRSTVISAVIDGELRSVATPLVLEHVESRLIKLDEPPGPRTAGES